MGYVTPLLHQNRNCTLKLKNMILYCQPLHIKREKCPTSFSHENENCHSLFLHYIGNCDPLHIKMKH